MKSTRTRVKNDVIGSRRSEPIILSDFLPQFYQGRVCKYAAGRATLAGTEPTEREKDALFELFFFFSSFPQKVAISLAVYGFRYGCLLVSVYVASTETHLVD
uniref:Uncharacterized protein n=1 Tax=Araneus ventricosus TaxID=182803 RepID=A0A4Y2EG11_ARAVE|nr:hypothetical protein AVEN_69392-1 [Araneus ventricosus]